MSSPVGDTGPARSFESRLNRVEDARAPHEDGKPEVSVLPDWRRDVAANSGILVAVLIGLLAVLAVRVGLFHFTGTAMLSDTPDITLVLEAGAASILAVAVLMFFPFNGLKFKLVELAAVAVMITAMHNLVHTVPGVFSLAFSPEWTANVLAQTEPKSILLRGEVIPLTTEEKVLPIVRRMN